MKLHNVGVALSGGGARGFAHLGALQALYERDIRPDAVSGVSAGAIVGAFLASGMEPTHIFQLLRDRGLFTYSKIRMPKDGLLSLDGLENLIKGEISEDTLESLPIPFWVAVTNLNKGTVEYLDQGSLCKSVMASSSIPILFAPVKLQGQHYVDGGIVDNLPVKPLKETCRHVIGLNISPLQQTQEIHNLLQIAIRVFQISITATTVQSRGSCDLLIEPEKLFEFDMLDSKKAEELFDIGYNFTEQLLITKLAKRGKIL